MDVTIFNDPKNINIILHIEKDNKTHILRFFSESDAIAFCEEVLNIIDYRVVRFEQNKKTKEIY